MTNNEAEQATASQRIYVLVAVDKRAITDGGSSRPAEEFVRGWVGQYLFDDQFAVADVTDLFDNESLVHAMWPLAEMRAKLS